MRFRNPFGKRHAHTSIPKDREYRFGDYSILLRGNHQLDVHQNAYPLFDRFLPEFCADFAGLIIDIGANIGDTSIAIFARNSRSYIVGVEADETFYNECLSNIKANKLDARFLGVNKFVSTMKGNFQVEKNATRSTGSISRKEKLDGPQNTVSFAELMQLIPPARTSPFNLLKIDTDGFDWDILNSLHEYAQAGSVMPQYIFFELQPYLNSDLKKGAGREHMTDKYQAALQILLGDGYDTFCLFDNFGTHIRITKSITEIVDFCDYITRSQEQNNHSTIYYMDVLAFNNNLQCQVIEKLSAFQKNQSPNRQLR